MADMSASVDEAASALISVFEAAREQAHTRLSASQLQALLAVEREEGLNLNALAERLSVILSSASRLCDRLVAAGVLDREPSSADRREVILTVTNAGQALLDELRLDRQRRLEEVLAAMSPAARDALLRGLREFGHAAGTLEDEARLASVRSA
jgi:DNA-binding MarR family transcriptional regulator